MRFIKKCGGNRYINPRIVSLLLFRKLKGSNPNFLKVQFGAQIRPFEYTTDHIKLSLMIILL